MEQPREWFYLQEGGSEGPETIDRLLELLDNGSISRQTLVWRQGAIDWQPLELALELDAGPPPIPGVRPGMSTPPADPAHLVAASSSLGLLGPYTDLSPHPWRRYFARLLDTTIGGSLLWLIVGVLLVAVDQDAAKSFFAYMSEPSSRIVNSVGTFLLAIFPIALLIGLTRSSIGKLIFGIRVSNPNASPIGFSKALKREFLVWVRGLGLAIPLVSLFTLVISFNNLKNDRITTWDRDLAIKITHRPATAIQMTLNIFGIILWLMCTFALIGLANG